MRFLTSKISRKRRSRFAGPAVLLAALVMTGGLYAALAPANADTNNPSSADVARGQALQAHESSPSQRPESSGNSKE